MAQRKIIWSEPARQEFIRILDFYNQRNSSPKYSIKLSKKIKTIVSHLKRNPFLGIPSNNENIRVIIIEVFLIFYHISDNQIDILSICDSRMNPELLLYHK